MSFKRNRIPKITIGKYAGTPIDQLPNSYLRWMVSQKFPKEWLDIAHEKLKASPYSNDYLEISRHAIDQFSLRFLKRWTDYIGQLPEGEPYVGIGTYVAKLAQEAWQLGADRSKRRHQDDGIVKELDGIKWVFNINPDYPDYKDVITVMTAEEQ